MFKQTYDGGLKAQFQHNGVAILKVSEDGVIVTHDICDISLALLDRRCGDFVCWGCSIFNLFHDAVCDTACTSLYIHNTLNYLQYFKLNDDTNLKDLKV